MIAERIVETDVKHKVYYNRKCRKVSSHVIDKFKANSIENVDVCTLKI